jgi:hypothetical protein
VSEGKLLSEAIRILDEASDGYDGCVLSNQYWKEAKELVKRYRDLQNES